MLDTDFTIKRNITCQYKMKEIGYDLRQLNNNPNL